MSPVVLREKPHLLQHRLHDGFAWNGVGAGREQCSVVTTLCEAVRAKVRGEGMGGAR